MPIYVDRLRTFGPVLVKYGKNIPSCHMTADTTVELQEFARKLGIPDSWLHRGSKDHYDLTNKWRKLAIEAGAKER